MTKVRHYIDELNAVDEHVRIEAKQCSGKIDKSVLETICAFSNEPELGGGTIVLGLEEKEATASRYSVLGVKDPDKLQKDLATQCATMFNHPIRPLIESAKVDGKQVIVVQVPELDAKLKPLYFKDAGLPKGAWRRVGSTDHRCCEEDLRVLFHDTDDFDIAIAQDCELDDIDDNAVKAYRRLRAQINPKSEELSYSDIDLLRSLNCIAKNKDGQWNLTNAGLLVFGKSMALRRVLPAVRIDYIRVAGTEWVPNPYNRFESIDMRGPLLLMVNRVFNAVADDLPRRFEMMPGSLQAHRPLMIPEDALREAIVNSLIHQNFRLHQPVQIIRYSNRIEIINPGFSLKPAEMLGEPGSRLRNPAISSIFHETQLAEAKGTGIGTMRRLMKDSALMPPTFESDRTRNVFTTRILLNHVMSEKNTAWLSSLGVKELKESQKMALIFLREVGAIDNITYRQLSSTSAMEASKELKALVNNGLIAAKGQGRKTYYVPTEIFRFSAADAGSVSPKVVTLDGKVVTSDDNVVTLEDIFGEKIVRKLNSLGKRCNKSDLEEVIIELCKVTPLSIEEIAVHTKRTVNYIRVKVLPGLLKENRIRFTIPEMKNHPNQKYKA